VHRNLTFGSLTVHMTAGGASNVFVPVHGIVTVGPSASTFHTLVASSDRLPWLSRALTARECCPWDRPTSFGPFSSQPMSLPSSLQ
jgi:hypothetical protein